MGTLSLFFIDILNARRNRRHSVAAPLSRSLLLSAIALIAIACGHDTSSTSPNIPRVVASVVMLPGNSAMVEGETQVFTARAHDAMGQEIPGRIIAWTSSNPTVATVQANGMISAIAAGTATIRAEVEGKSATATITVILAPVHRVQLPVASLTLNEGDTQTVTLTAFDSAGRVLTGRTIAWTSSNPAAATIDGNGKITAVQTGNTTISATVEGRTATLTATVRVAPVATVLISPGPVLLEIGESVQLTAVVKDASGRILTGRAVQWRVDNSNAIISPSGLVTGAKLGFITVLATSEGVTSGLGGTITTGDDFEFDLLYHRGNLLGTSELFVLPLAGGSVPQRLNAGTVSRNATASPAGTRIAFAVSMDDLGTATSIDDIFAVDRNGMNMKQITKAAGREDQPSWSPVGGRIAYHAATPDGRSDIWVMNDDGSAQTNLTASMSVQGVRSGPAWSWDGQRIAFAQIENGVAGSTSSIWVMNADGSNLHQVTSTLSGFDAMPTWSPNGLTIAFRRYFDGDADITTVSLATGQLQRIQLPGNQASPAWSPDGAYIAFTQDFGLTTNVFTMRVNGTRVRLRTIDQSWGGGLDPSWIRRN